jgi:hypothetical protein
MRMSAKTKTSTKPKASARAKASAKGKMSARSKVRTKAKMSAETKNRYRVLEKEESDRIVEIGLITFSRDHKLEVVSAAPSRRQFLDSIVRMFNAREIIHVIVPPPAEAEPHDIYAQPIKRSDAGFREALVDSLKTDYGIELRPA